MATPKPKDGLPIGGTYSIFDKVQLDLDARHQFEVNHDTIRSDANAALVELIAEANQTAALEDGKIHVRGHAYPRIVYFVPGVETGVPFFPPNISWSPTEPILRSIDSPIRPFDREQAVEAEWTDTYVFAKRLFYRYSNPRITSLEYNGKFPNLVARATVDLDTAVTVATAEHVGPLPKPLPGYRTWSPDASRFEGMGNLRAAHGTGLPPWDTVVPLARMGKSNGQEYSAIQTPKPLFAQAIATLEEAEPEAKKRTLDINLYYSFELDRWLLRYQPTIRIDLPAIPQWDHGLEAYTGTYVTRPPGIR